MKHKVLDLFAGIGGFSLGLDRAGGFETVAFCEDNLPAQKVLKKHWPDVPIYGDIKELTHDRLQADGIFPTIITGGFPCQDISAAGKGEGITGDRSSLWSEMLRLIRDVRPTWAIAENVSALRSRGLTLVAQNLSEIGYDAEWHCIPASAVGIPPAPHIRDRIWIVAYPSRKLLEERQHDGGTSGGRPHGQPSGPGETLAHPNKGLSDGESNAVCPGGDAPNSGRPNGAGFDVADTNGEGLQGHGEGLEEPCQILTQETAGLFSSGTGSDQWAVEPDVGRVAHGVPNRVDRIKQLGNSVVPQIPEMLGRAIMAFEGHKP